MSTQIVRDLVCSGRITAAQGAELLAFRRLLAWKRRPWIVRVLIVMLGGGP